MMITKELLKAMRTCGLRHSQIAQATGIEQSALSRFVSGERSLSLEAADKLAAFFKLELRPKGRAK